MSHVRSVMLNLEQKLPDIRECLLPLANTLIERYEECGALTEYEFNVAKSLVRKSPKLGGTGEK